MRSDLGAHRRVRHRVPNIVDASVPIVRSAVLAGPRRYVSDRATQGGVEREIQAESSRLELLDQEAASPFVLREIEVKSVSLEEPKVLAHREQVVTVPEHEARTIGRERRWVTGRSVRIVPVLLAQLQQREASGPEDPADLFEELDLALEETDRHRRVDQVDAVVVEMETGRVVEMQLG